MNKIPPNELWEIFLSCKASSDELAELGASAGHKRSPSKPAVEALKHIGKSAYDKYGHLAIMPSHLYAAMIDSLPASKLACKGVLEGIAFHWREKTPFNLLGPAEAQYIVSLASALTLADAPQEAKQEPKQQSKAS